MVEAGGGGIFQSYGNAKKSVHLSPLPSEQSNNHVIALERQYKSSAHTVGTRFGRSTVITDIG